MRPIASRRGLVLRRRGWGRRGGVRRRRSRGRRRRLWLALPLAVAALEALHPATGVNQLLLAGEEGVALVAQFDVEVGLGGVGDERVPARALDRGVDVVRVNVGLHGVSSEG